MQYRGSMRGSSTIYLVSLLSILFLLYDKGTNIPYTNIIFTFLFLYGIKVFLDNTSKKIIRILGIAFYGLLILLIISNKVYYINFSSYLNYSRIKNANALLDIHGMRSIIFSSNEMYLFILACMFNFIFAIKRIYIFKIKRMYFIRIKGLNSLKKSTIISASLLLSYVIGILIWGNNLEVFSAFLFNQEIEASAISYSQERDEIETSNYKGIGKNKNLIIIQLESFQNCFINVKFNGQEITPNLNKLIKNDSIYFNNYYQQIGVGKTADAEFISMHSIHGVTSSSVYDEYPKNYYYGLPKILKEEGYTTNVLHGYKDEFYNRNVVYPNIGYDKYYSEEYFENLKKFGWGVVDEEFYKLSVEYMQSFKQPFFSYLISLSTHLPYEIDRSIMKFDAGKYNDTDAGKYVININYSDYAVGQLINALEKEPFYKNSIIVLYGDHHGMTMYDKKSNYIMKEILGREYNYSDMMQMPLIIHVPGLSHSKTIERIGGQIDFLPTIMNLMGIDKSRTYYMGEDLLNPDKKDKIVSIQTYMLKGSFFDQEYIFEMDRGGIFEHSAVYDRKTGLQIEQFDKGKFKEKSDRAKAEVDYSKYILDNDLLKDIIYDKRP